MTPGAQFAEYRIADPYTDEQCRDVARVVPPQFVLPAHAAPLGCAFNRDPCFGFVGDMFVASHGSFDRTPAVGYSLYRITFVQGQPMASEVFVGTGTTQGQFRPVNIVFDGAGRAFLSSDFESKVYVITPTAGCATSATTTTTTETAAPTTAAPTTAPSSTTSHSVIVGPTTDPFRFFVEPSGGDVVTVDMGDEIVWTWETNYHSVTFGNDCLPSGMFDSQIQDAGYSFALPITAPMFSPGTSYNFFCSPHCSLGQVGTVVVRGDPLSTTTTSAPTTAATTTITTPPPTTASTTTTTSEATTTPAAGDGVSRTAAVVFGVVVFLILVAIVVLVVVAIRRRRAQVVMVNSPTQDGEATADNEFDNNDLL